MKATIIILGIMSIAFSMTLARPGHFGEYFYSFPAPSSQTTVLRDALGNQATSYAYQDGHSSSVAVSRNDVSKHLAYVPVPAPVVYEESIPASYHLPTAYYGNPAAYYGNYGSYYA